MAEKRKCDRMMSGKIKIWIIAAFLTAAVSGCERYNPYQGQQDKGTEEAETENHQQEEESFEQKGDKTQKEKEEPVKDTGKEPLKEKTQVKVKGIYVSAYVAGTEEMMDSIIEQMEQTELNAVVIDVKDDNGRVTFQMDSPLVQEVGACADYIPDIQKLVDKLKEHQFYLIARIPAFRDPFLADKRQEWCCKLADGSVYRDKNHLAWVNPYRREVWDYLVEIGKKAGEAGFDEIQFDYIRFCTEKGMNEVVFEDSDTQGKSRQEIILEFARYAYDQLAEEGLFVSADVFGAVIGGGEDAEAVGQDYAEMTASLDYICPMIYPSHYGDGYFGIAHPDTQPYDTIFAALSASQKDLSRLPETGKKAVVRPWLQDFTASYLRHYIPYKDLQVSEQIQAVYDAGYEEWILWNASSNYHYQGVHAGNEQ